MDVTKKAVLYGRDAVSVMNRCKVPLGHVQFVDEVVPVAELQQEHDPVGVLTVTLDLHAAGRALRIAFCIPVVSVG